MDREQEIQRLFRKGERMPDNPRTSQGRIRFYELNRRLAELHDDQSWVDHWDRAIAHERS
jgi:hypothetical protein